MANRLTREIAFYRKYHRNPINVGLHIVGIPTILESTLYGLSMFRLQSAPLVNLGVALAVYYLYYYSKLDPTFGPPVGLFIVLTSLYFSCLTTRSSHYVLSWSLWTIGWIAQFIGHGVFEGRAPALFDNLHQALILAPYFAFLEIAALLGWAHAKNEIAKIDVETSTRNKSHTN